MKRSKSNGLKSRKRPGKKSGNAKKMRRTRKNKGGTFSQGFCKGSKFVGYTALYGAFGIFILYAMSQGAADFSSGSSSGPTNIEVSSLGSSTGTTKGSLLDCNSLRKKVYQSLKEINLAKKIIARNTIWNFTYKYEIIENVDITGIEPVIDQKQITTILKIFGDNMAYHETTNKYDIVYIKKNTGILVDKDEYYLFKNEKNGTKTLDVFRSIAFTHINRYISKKGYDRKYHLLSLLKSDNAINIFNKQIKKIDDMKDEVQKKIKEISDEMNAKIKEEGRALYSWEKREFDNKLEIEQKKLKKFEDDKNDFIDHKKKFMKFWTAFRSAAIYLCNRHTAEGAKYNSRTNLKNVCENENTSKPDYKEIINSVEELIILPSLEYNIYTENRVYPEDVQWHTEQKLNQVIQ